MGNCQQKNIDQTNLLNLSEEEQFKYAENKIEEILKGKQYQDVQEKENQIFDQLGGIKYGVDYQVKNIVIKLKDNSYQWIHTYICGNDDKKQQLVLLHGYGGTGVTYYRMIKQLIQRYQVFCIDMIGTGQSSRPEFNLTDPTQIIDYFNDVFEQWRQRMKLTYFILSGHSFGGYLAGQYALKQPQYIQRLVLISPAGVSKKTEEENLQSEKALTDNLGFFKKQLYKKVKDKFNNQQLSITHIANTWYIPTNMMMNRYFSRRLQLPDNEVELMKQYFKLIYKFPVSAEKAFNSLFMFPSISAKISLYEQFPNNISVFVHFIYGDYDWMNKKGAEKLIQTEQLIKGSYYVLQNSGHQIPFENPAGMSQYFLNLAYDDNKVNDKKQEEKQIQLN